VPEPLWWLLGAVVSFYFGARHQTKGQEFQRSLAETLARAPAVIEAARAVEEPKVVTGNAALEDWAAGRQ
ncbi:MAG: 3TM-type holin, partial [Pseudomonadota bacterium]